MLDRRGVLLALGLCFPASRAAVAAEQVANRGRKRRDLEDDDHERALDAFHDGKIRSLSEILAELRAKFGGEVFEVELKTTGEAYVYEFKVLTPDGRIIEVSVDAASGKQDVDGGRQRPDRTREDEDHESARKAFKQGKIRSLSGLMAALGAQLGSEVFEVELKTIGETYVYEFKVLTSDGRISDVSVDAASGRIIKSESE